MKIFTAHGKRIYNINCLCHVFISRQKQTHVGQVILILRVEAAIPHSTGLAICFAHLALWAAIKPGKRNAKDGAKLRGVSQRKYDIHMGLAEDFKQMLRYIVFIEMKSKFGLYSS